MSSHHVDVDAGPNNDNYKGIVVKYIYEHDGKYEHKVVHREFSDDIKTDAINIGKYIRSVGMPEVLLSDDMHFYFQDNDMEYDLTLPELIEKGWNRE